MELSFLKAKVRGNENSSYHFDLHKHTSQAVVTWWYVRHFLKVFDVLGF